MVNIDYGTLLVLSVPGFLIGIMTGRFLPADAGSPSAGPWEGQGGF